MNYCFPSISLLERHNTKNRFSDEDYVLRLQKSLKAAFEGFKIKGEVIDSQPTPFAVLFDVTPKQGESVKNIEAIGLTLKLRWHLRSKSQVWEKTKEQLV